MSETISFIAILFFGWLSIFFILTFLRVCKSGAQMAGTVIKSGFTIKNWWNASLPNPGYHPSYQTTSGIRARVGRKGLIITPTRTLSRREL